MITSSAGASDFAAPVVVAPGVITALHQATHATLRMLGHRLAPLGLSGSEQNVLAALADGQPRMVGKLAAATGTKPTTLTSVLDRLEEKGLLLRRLDPADRRSFLIGLTPAGRRTASEVHAAVLELERTALSGLTDAQIAGFRAVAQALTEARI